MFVPSESLFAELHENFADIVQKANRARVVIVSPSLLMLSIQVIQSILRMRKQAHVVQSEVRFLMEDVGRLEDRVAKLQQRHRQTGEAIEQILTSAGKISRRSERIDALDLDEEEEARRSVADVADETSEDVLPIPLKRAEPGSARAG